MIDLHCHTRFSDGSLSPTELVELAARRGLSAVAVTDHDTVDGLEEALAAGERLGIEVVPGIEINLEHDQVTMDLLGYFLAGWPSEELRDQLAELRAYRDERNARILERLGELGYPVAPEELAGIAEEGAVGQAPHRRGHAAPRLRALDRRGVRALPAPRRPRLGRPPASRTGPRRAAAARVRRPAGHRSSRDHPCRPARTREDRARRRQARRRRPRVPLSQARGSHRRVLPVALRALRPRPHGRLGFPRRRETGRPAGHRRRRQLRSPTSCSRGCAAMRTTPSAEGCERPHMANRASHPARSPTIRASGPESPRGV